MSRTQKNKPSHPRTPRICGAMGNMMAVLTNVQCSCCQSEWGHCFLWINMCDKGVFHQSEGFRLADGYAIDIFYAHWTDTITLAHFLWDVGKWSPGCDNTYVHQITLLLRLMWFGKLHQESPVCDNVSVHWPYKNITPDHLILRADQWCEPYLN